LKRADWAARRVPDAGGTALLVVLWVFTLFWYGMLGLMGLLAWTRPPTSGTQGGALAVLGLFALAGLVILNLAVRATWHRLRFGRSAFEMDGLPFQPGGWVSGVVHAPADLGVDDFAVTLDCTRVRESGRSTHRTVVWREVTAVGRDQLGRDASARLVPVSIAVPADALPTCGERGKRVEWTLSVSATRPGLDYEASFELPVFETGRLPPDRVRTPSPMRPDDMRPPSSRIRVEPRADGAVIQYPTPSWLKGWTVVPILIVPAAAAAGWLLFPDDRISALLCAAAGVAFALFLLAITAFGLLTTPNRVEIHGDTVVVRRGLFGRGWDRRIPRQQVVAVKHVPLQNGPRVDYTVDIATRDGRNYNAALGLRDLGEARWLAHEIERQIRAGS
jgi:hypothetical protein